MVVAFGARKKPRLFRAEQVAEETLIGSGADPSLVPCAISVGMVLIWQIAIAQRNRELCATPLKRQGAQNPLELRILWRNK